MSIEKSLLKQLLSKPEFFYQDVADHFCWKRRVKCSTSEKTWDYAVVSSIVVLYPGSLQASCLLQLFLRKHGSFYTGFLRM